MARVRILGVYVGPHGASATLLEDGVPSVAIQLERILGVKHAWLIGKRINQDFARERVKLDFQSSLLDFDEHFPRLIEYICGTANVKLSDIDFIALEDRHILNNPSRTYEIDGTNELDGYFERNRILRVEHHQGHQAQALFASPFEEAAVVTIDGRSWAPMERLGTTISVTISRGQGNQIDTVFESQLSLVSQYHHLSLLLFGKRYCEGKTMGLAPFGSDNPYAVLGTECLSSTICASRPVTQCAKHTVQNSIFCKQHQIEVDQFRERWIYPIERTSSQEGATLNRTSIPGLDRMLERPKVTEYPGLGSMTGGRPPTTAQKVAAYLCQYYYEKELFRILRLAHEELKLPDLCLAGGAGLNSVANGKIRQETPFQNVFVFPNCGDEGLSMGFGLWAHHVLLNNKRTWKIQTDSLGRVYSRDEILEQTTRRKAECSSVVRGPAIYSDTAERLARGQIGAWFQGRSEFGPRALGHRSILAHPGLVDSHKRVNLIKGRELWRPSAPAILKEWVSEYFDLEFESPYMLFVASVLSDKRGTIPSVTHVDGTSRVQTVDRDIEPAFYQLIDQFRVISGLPLLLNTSFNIQGKPLVESPQQALEAFLSTELDFLVMEDVMVTRISQQDKCSERT